YVRRLRSQGRRAARSAGTSERHRQARRRNGRGSRLRLRLPVRRTGASWLPGAGHRLQSAAPRRAEGRARGLPVEAIAGDFRDVAKLVPTAVELAVCMGDTISHLECEADLTRVFDGVAARLAVGGRLVLTFRDLSSELCDLDRVIPLYASDERVMTCFLDYGPR